MDDQKVQLLRDEIQGVKEDVREIRKDVKSLISFKGKIVGGIVAASTFFSGLFAIIMKFVIGA